MWIVRAEEENGQEESSKEESRKEEKSCQEESSKEKSSEEEASQEESSKEESRKEEASQEENREEESRQEDHEEEENHEEENSQEKRLCPAQELHGRIALVGFITYRQKGAPPGAFFIFSKERRWLANSGKSQCQGPYAFAAESRFAGPRYVCRLPILSNRLCPSVFGDRQGVVV